MTKKKLKIKTEVKRQPQQKRKNKKKRSAIEESDESVATLCNDDELDDIDMELVDVDSFLGIDDEVCGLCGDQGKEKEL